jgi:predicted acylesterase/phospholipase RssA
MVTALVNITLVGTNPKVDLSTFATQLTEALGSIGDTLHLSSRRIERLWESERMGQPSLDVERNIKLENWLSEQESKYRFIIYEVDVTASHWTRRCLRQADRILLIGDTEMPHDHGPLEAELPNPDTRHTTAEVELVLVHPPEQIKFQNTDKWLETRHVSAHYHVRRGVGADFARLARLLTGHGMGLALGGGGLRGLAHIGVIRALQESNITIDFIGGTSMGAIMAAQFAMGWDYDTIIRANRKMWSDSWPMNDYTFPFIACLSGQKLDHALHQMFGETRIEDLAMRYFCVSTNLTTARLAVHQDGLLWKRIRASCSLPGIVPPEFDNDSMLVDGAVLNNVPGDIMKKLCGGQVVAVDVSPREDLVFQPQCPERPPTKQIFWNQMNPFGQKPTLPSLFDIVARSAMLSSASNTNFIRDQVDLYLDIPMDQFGMSDVKSFDQIIDTGYQFASQQIEKWKQKEKT